MDVRTLVNARPTGQLAQQIVSGYVSVNQPAPTGTSGNGILSVIVPSWSSEHAMQFTDWPDCHGATAPAAGDFVLLAYDEQRIPHVIYWIGTYSDPGA